MKTFLKIIAFSGLAFTAFIVFVILVDINGILAFIIPTALFMGGSLLLSKW